MKQFSLIFVLIILSISQSQAKLKIVAEIYRHGARGTLSSYYDGNSQPDIAGELTATGQRQHYNLGQFLREEYVNKTNFMPEQYNHSLIYVRADDFNRTIMSAYSHFQGFYPQGFGAQLPSNLSYDYTLPPFRSPDINIDASKSLGINALPNQIQVLPVHVISTQTDFIFLAQDICPNYGKYSNDYHQEKTQVYNFVNSQMSQTLQQLTQIFNQTISSVDDAYSLTDVIYCDTNNGRYVPPIPSEVEANLTFIYNFFSFYEGLKEVKVATQPYFEEIFGYFDQIIAGNSSLKWISHSGHDTNIGPLLQALNLSSIECQLNQFYKQGQSFLNCADGPHFASHILFEIHEQEENVINDKSQLYVRVRYNGQYMNLCDRNSTQCSYLEFESRIKQQFENYNLLCGMQTDVFNNPQILSQNIGVEEDEEYSYKLNVFQILIPVFVQIFSVLILFYAFKKIQLQQKEIKVLRERLLETGTFEYQQQID
ncbi:histidine acid phosphatase family protein (macronuclear) [Tetrahymena thermophila SB210]|uniref:Histidine acid phosphatase family protein n=1 Tax=Tetrahymena thermophila (strain SB210) TaxID=312017 RepID=I7MDB9_TETTS|nr:histidine acid phosphatase family protein [Tetrahymena thermophila SB210]EAR87292.2 histidine acid phosphatase family protein [Tetrahymena thermophila SB210]|eukprot:XP_001007537.2 histidine acid phosphatase family protein [Tetrahymena thermophila SB210]